MKRIYQALLPALLLLALGGCSFSDNLLLDADQVAWDNQASLGLEPGQPVGQTFVARHAGLAAVEFFVLPGDAAPTTLTLHLRADPQAGDDLATASLALPAGASPGFYRFSFAPRDDSLGTYYYAFLKSPGPGVALATSGGAAYLDGAAHQDHQPLDAQTTFRLAYATGPLALDLLGAVAGGLGLVGAAALLYLVPGWALLVWLLPGRRLSWAETLGLGAGISLALYPLLLLWTDLVGLHLGPLYAWLPAGLGLLGLAWYYRRWRPRQVWAALRRWLRSPNLWPDLALLAVLAVAVGVRLLAVRSLDAPMWGDSYQHTMIAQLLVDHGGLFDSWAPYVPLDRLTYHFGFHSAVAAMHWLTGMPVMQATIWTGQLLNALAVFALYPLAVRVAGSRWAGVWAVLLAGLLTRMPMFYLNWGRYTQLAGLAILPAAMWLTWEAVDEPAIDRSKRSGWLIGLAALVAAGLALTHYRVLIFYAVFVLALGLISLRRQGWRAATGRLAGIGLGAGLLFVPWLVNTMGSTLLAALGQRLTTPPAQMGVSVEEYNAVGSLEAFLAPVWWLALVLGLGLGLWQRRRGALLVGLRWLLLLLATNPAWLSLPGTGIISNFALFIAVYVPAALLSGILVASIVPRLPRARWASWSLALLVLLLGLWGARERIGEPDPLHNALVTRPDLRAADWIRNNTPPDAHFLVNSFFAYGGTVLAGSDGGWWLPLLTGRQNSVPPMGYNSELDMAAPYRLQIHELASQVQTLGVDDPATLATMEDQGIRYVYIGQKQGGTNYAGPGRLDPQILLDSPHYRPVYHQDRVWIFEFLPPE